MRRFTLSTLVIGMFALSLIVPAHQGHAAFNFFGGHKKVKAVDGAVLIPLADINDGHAHHFKYRAAGTDIKFFVVKSTDGVIRAAFDACDVCFPAKKGYTQDGDFMICNNCGRRFHSTRINVVEGGCNPAPLNRTVVADNLVIRVNDIVPGARYF